MLYNSIFLIEDKLSKYFLGLKDLSENIYIYLRFICDPAMLDLGFRTYFFYYFLSQNELNAEELLSLKKDDWKPIETFLAAYMLDRILNNNKIIAEWWQNDWQ